MKGTLSPTRLNTDSGHILSKYIYIPRRMEGISITPCCLGSVTGRRIQPQAGVCLYRSEFVSTKLLLSLEAKWLMDPISRSDLVSPANCFAAGNEGETSAAMAALEDEELDAGAWGEAELDLENGDAEAADGEPAAGGEAEEEEDGGWEMDVRITLEP